MARNTCPGCGRPYNGRKCRVCLYETFPDGVARGPRAPKGTPLVTDVPSGRKQPREKTSRQKNPLSRFLLLLMLIYSLMPMLRNWGLDLKAREQAARPAASIQAEPVMATENMVMFHQESGVTIFTSQDNLVDFSDGFCLYVQNDTDMDVTVSAGDITVDGCSMPHSSLVCRAGANAIGKGWLELDAQDLKKSDIQKYRTLSFTLTALQNSRTLFTTGEILLTSGVDAYE